MIGFISFHKTFGAVANGDVTPWRCDQYTDPTLVLMALLCSHITGLELTVG